MIFPVWRLRHDPKDLYGGLSRIELSSSSSWKLDLIALLNMQLKICIETFFQCWRIESRSSIEDLMSAEDRETIEGKIDM